MGATLQREHWNGQPTYVGDLFRVSTTRGDKQKVAVMFGLSGKCRRGERGPGMWRLEVRMHTTQRSQTDQYPATNVQ